MPQMARPQWLLLLVVLVGAAMLGLVYTAPTPPAAGTPFSGFTSVSVKATAHGALTWSLPLELAPGTHGMLPSLEVSFSSRSLSSNGVMGRGASLRGTTFINRCASSVARDGRTWGVHLDAADNFCLGGQRLVNISGLYGGPGTVYSTEIKSYSRIVSVGTAGTGPLSWQVTTKTGHTMELGGTPDSRVLAPGSSGTVATWYESKSSDIMGNYFTITYEQNPQAGAIQIAFANYTANDKAGLVPYNSVQFVYESRPDVVTTYLAGMPISVPSRLAAVQCLVGGRVFRQYAMTYAQQPLTAESLLTSITECRVDTGACLPPLTLNWDTIDGSAGYASMPAPNLPVETTNVQQAQLDASRVKVADLNRDGLMDIYRIQGFNGMSADIIYLNDGNGAWQMIAGPTILHVGDDITKASADVMRLRLMDLNGDTCPDILVFPALGAAAGSPIQIFPAHCDGTFDTSPVNGPGIPQAVLSIIDYQRYQFGDFDGNGLVDLYMLGGDARGANHDTLALFLDTNFHFQLVAGPVTVPVRAGDPALGNGDVNRVRLADFDGDALCDVLVIPTTSAQAVASTIIQSISSGPGSVAFANHAGPTFDIAIDPTGAITDLARIKIGDFNLDGAKDVYVVSYSNSAGVAQPGVLFVHTGAWQFIQMAAPAVAVRTGEWAGFDISRVLFVDCNKDGRTDIAWVGDATHPGFVLLSTGAGFVAPIAGPTTPLFDTPMDPQLVDARMRRSDWNGDGSIDLLIVNGTFATNAIQLSPFTNGPRLVAIQNGAGVPVTIAYAHMTDKTVYTVAPPTGVAFPVVPTVSTADIVASVSNIDGLGGVNTVVHTYTGGLRHMQGLGDLGFASIVLHDLSTNHVTTEYFSQDWQHRTYGRPIERTDAVNGGTVTVKHSVSTLASQVDCTAVNARCTFDITMPYALFETFDLATARLLTSKQSNYTFDAYGNHVTVLTKTSDNVEWFWSNVTHQYAYNEAAWLMGMLQDATSEYRSSNSSESIVARETFVVDPATGLVQSSVREPDSPTLALTTASTYDVFGNAITQTKSGYMYAARTSSVQFDARGCFQLQQKNPLGHVTSWTYDAGTGSILTATDPNGVVTSYSYDSLGVLTSTQFADGSQAFASSVWCALGAATCAVPAQLVHAGFPSAVPIPPTAVSMTGSVTRCGVPSLTVMDQLSRTVRTIDIGLHGELRAADVEYNHLGQAVRKTAPFILVGSNAVSPAAAPATTIVYDTLGRVLNSTLPDGALLQSHYDGLRAIATDPLGRTSWQQHNCMGVVTEVEDAAGSTMRYAYNAAARLLSIQGVDGSLELVQTLDTTGRVVSSWSADSAMASFNYSAGGELLESLDALGVRTTLTYDLLGRMVSRVQPDATWYWTYDNSPHAIGSLVNITSPTLGYSATMSYDNFGRQQTSSVLPGMGLPTLKTTIKYDGCSRAMLTQDPTGLQTCLAFGANGQTTAVSNCVQGSVPYYQLQAIDASARPVQTQYGSAITTSLTYSVRGWVDASSLIVGTSHVMDISLAHDLVGNVIGRTLKAAWAGTVSQSYSFDALNRLTTADDGVGAPVTVKYAPNGNIMYKSDVGTYTYGAQAGPHAVTSIAPGAGSVFESPVAIRYDAAGREVSAGQRVMTYWASGMPRTITNSINALSNGTELVYDANGKLLTRKDVDGTVTIYHPDVTMVVDASGKPSSCRHHPHPAVVVTSSCDGTAGDIYYTDRDQQGSVLSVLDWEGNVVQHQLYSAWGIPLSVLPGNITDAGFTSHRQLPTFGLVHMGARLYDPLRAAFTSADPTMPSTVHSQALHPYAYVLNNPVSIVDGNGFGLFGSIFSGISHFFSGIAHDLSHLVSDIAHAISHDWESLALDAIDIALICTGNGEFVPLVNAAATLAEDRIEGKSWTMSLEDTAFSLASSYIPGGKAGMIIRPFMGGIESVAHGGNFARGFASGLVGDAFGEAKLTGVGWGAVQGAISSEIQGGNVLDGAINGAMSGAEQDASNAQKAAATKLAAASAHKTSRAGGGAAGGGGKSGHGKGQELKAALHGGHAAAKAIPKSAGHSSHPHVGGHLQVGGHSILHELNHSLLKMEAPFKAAHAVRELSELREKMMLADKIEARAAKYGSTKLLKLARMVRVRAVGKVAWGAVKSATFEHVGGVADALHGLSEAAQGAGDVVKGAGFVAAEGSTAETVEAVVIAANLWDGAGEVILGVQVGVWGVEYIHHHW